MSLFDDTLANAERRFAAVQSAAEAQSIGEENIAELALTGAGQTAGMLGDVIGYPLELVGSFVFNRLPESAQETARGLLTSALESYPVQELQRLSEENPRTAENIGYVLNIASAIPFVGSGIRFAKNVPDAGSGNIVAGASNYIPDRYGTIPEDNLVDRPLTTFEKNLGTMIVKRREPNFKGTNTPSGQQKAAKAARRVKGFVNWVLDSPFSALKSTISPRARALYNETGLNRETQKRIAALIADPTNKRNVEKAMAQAIYNRHINRQANREGTEAAELKKIDEFAFTSPYTAVTKENFVNGVKNTKVAKVNKVTEADVEFAYDSLVKTQTPKQGKTTMVFKVPFGTASGNHFQDFAQRAPYRTPASNVIKDILASGRKPTEQNILTGLKNHPEKGKRFKILTKNSKDAKEKGVWVQSTTFVGGSIVEGGITAVARVYPDGRFQNYMYDTHDFLEKVPVLGKTVEKVLPTKMIATSGPIFTRGKDIGPPQAISELYPSKIEENVAALEAVVDLNPSAFGYAKEAVGLFGGIGKEALRETREFAREEEEKKNQT